MKIAIITAYDSANSELFSLIKSNHVKYCKLNGYKYISKLSTPEILRKEVWLKEKVILEELKKEHNDIDWFFWCDLDSIFLTDQSLDKFIKDINKNICFILTHFPIESVEHPFVLHTGHYFIRNTKKSYNFLNKLYSNSKVINDRIGDSVGFAEYFLYDIPFRKTISIVPKETFLSEGNFMYHPMGKSYMDKYNLLKGKLDELNNSI